MTRLGQTMRNKQEIRHESNIVTTCASTCCRELVGGKTHEATVVDGYILTTTTGKLASPDVFLNGGGDPAIPLNATSPIKPQVMRVNPQTQTFTLPGTLPVVYMQQVQCMSRTPTWA